MILTTVDLFAGIGGFARGLEATGHFRTTCFVEQDPYCQAVLKHHWPDIPILDDIRDAQRSDFPDTRPDLVCGGFPCQPFSQAGRQRAQDDPRHLWPEMFRVIRELRPTWVIGENVVGLVKLGLDEVLTDLEGEGYATRTFNIPACATGAPHLRQRIWVIAHADSESEPDQPVDGGPGSRQLGFDFGGSEATSHGSDPNDHGSHRAEEHQQDTQHGQAQLRDKQVRESGQVGEDVADPDDRHRPRKIKGVLGEQDREASDRFAGKCEDVADPKDDRVGRWKQQPQGSEGTRYVADPNRSGQCEQRGSEPVQEEQSASECTGEDVADAQRKREGRRGVSGPGQDKSEDGKGSSSQPRGHGEAGPEDHWQSEPPVGRLVDGLPNRVSQLRALGNSIIPQIAEQIGHAIKVAHDGDV